MDDPYWQRWRVRVRREAVDLWSFRGGLRTNLRQCIYGALLMGTVSLVWYGELMPDWGLILVGSIGGPLLVSGLDLCRAALRVPVQLDEERNQSVSRLEGRVKELETKPYSESLEVEIQQKISGLPPNAKALLRYVVQRGYVEVRGVSIDTMTLGEIHQAIPFLITSALIDYEERSPRERNLLSIPARYQRVLSDVLESGGQ